jgi:O-antigen/teichoic acid export membrane protein
MSPTESLSLRSRVLSGFAWKAASQFVLHLSRILVGIVLARLLAPSDYGLAAMVLVASSLVLVFADLALGSALVQRRTLSEKDRSTVFWTSFLAGSLFTVLGILAAGPIADFYGEEEVRPLFAVLSVSFVITSLGTTQRALLSREMKFRSLEVPTIVATLAGAAVGLALAFLGYGAWAIIAQHLAIAVVSTLLLWVASPWRPRVTYSLASLRNLGGFSANVFGTRLVFYLNRNVDNLLIGRFLGPAALGAYALAYNVMLIPLSRLAGPIQDVLFPAFSRLRDEPARMAAVWLRVNRVVAAISLPALAGLVVVAPDFVAVVLGDRWEAATPVIQILAWVGMLQSLQRLNSSILQARDRTGALLGYSLLAFAASLVAFVVGLQWGIVGVAAAYAVTSSFVEPFYTWLTARAVGSSLLRFAKNVTGIATACAVMVVALLATRMLLLDAGLSAGPRLAVLVAVGAAVYLPCCAWQAPDLLDELRRLRRRRSDAREAVGATVP